MFQTKKCFLVLLLISFSMVCVLSPTLNSSSFAEEIVPETVIKTAVMKKEPSGISPNHLTVKLGTTIVWFNNDPEPVTIKFIDKLGIACRAPVNFYSDLWGYYETSTIPQGGTASICFIYKGDYKYEVRRIVSGGKGKQTEQITIGEITAVE